MPGSACPPVKSRNTTCGSMSARRRASCSGSGSSCISRPRSPMAWPSCCATSLSPEQKRKQVLLSRAAHSRACVFMFVTVKSPASAGRSSDPAGNSPRR
ncbi:Uncharacterised protein [Bordetella pertussis]|nr:Uncharacterised protein [Bordetella pertussis]